jgi:hypothetical protein
MARFTIITTGVAITVEGDRWTRDPEGGVYVYPAGGDHVDPVAEVDADEFVAITRGSTAVVRDTADTTATATTTTDS